MQAGHRLADYAGRAVGVLAGDAGDAVSAVNGRRAVLLAVLVVLALLALNLYAPAGPGISLRLLAGLLLLLCAAPALRWAAGSGPGDSGFAGNSPPPTGGKRGRFGGSGYSGNGSALPVCGFAYGLYFASPVFLRDDFTLPWRPEAAISAGQIEFVLLLALGGWTLLLAGYWLMGRDWAARKLPRLNLPSGPAANLLSRSPASISASGDTAASNPASIPASGGTASSNPASIPASGETAASNPASIPASGDTAASSPAPIPASSADANGGGNPRLDLALGVGIGVVSLPFLYLDKAAVAAFYTGEALLPSAVAFPVHFLGQLSLLAMLLLFFRQLRGGLPWPGRLFLGALVAVYTLLGLSTGLALQGLTAVFALFVAYAVAGRRPTWRWALGGAALLAAALFLLLPSRPEFRVLTWTRGIDPDAYILGRVQPYILIPPETLAAAERDGRGTDAAARELLDRYGLAASSRYEIIALPPTPTPDGAPAVDSPPHRIYWDGAMLIYSHRDAGVCHLPPDAVGAPVFFAHIFPSDIPLPEGGGGALSFASLEFPLAESGRVSNGRCEVRVPLPDYPIAFLRAGQYFAGVNWPIAQAQQTALTGRVGRDGPAARRELGAYVSGSVDAVDREGEWQLRTRAPGDWRIDPFFTAASRLLLHETDGRRPAELLRVGPGQTVIVQIDEQNWGEYLISRAALNGTQIAFWLAELINARGEFPPAPDGAAATLIYPAIPEPPPAAATATDANDGNGVIPPANGPRRNPAAPGAAASQLDKAALYLRTLWRFALSRPYTPESLRQSLDAAAQRLDLLLPLAWAAAQTPEPQPYLRGETYYPLLFKPVPRFLYPDKPTEVTDLGQRYGLIAAGNETNRYNLHQLGELYLNFGIAGALAGMFLLGAALRAIYGMFCRPGAPLLTLAAGAHLLTVLLAGMESLASASWGFVLWYAVFLALLYAGQSAVNWQLRIKN